MSDDFKPDEWPMPRMPSESFIQGMIECAAMRIHTLNEIDRIFADRRVDAMLEELNIATE